MKYGNQQLTDALLNDGLWCSRLKIGAWANGGRIHAEEYEVTREAMDGCAGQSSKSSESMEAGKFKDENRSPVEHSAVIRQR